MDTIFSTTAVHPRDRFDYWHEVACKAIVIHDSRPEDRRSFEAELRAAPLADLGLIVFRNAAMGVRRTPQHISQATSDDLFACVQLSRTLRIEQGDRESALAPNDLWLFDPNIPHCSKFENDTEMLSVKIPRALLEARLGKIPAVPAQPLRSAVGQFASSYLQALVAYAGNITEGAELIQQQVLDLVGLAASEAFHANDVNFSSSKAAIVHRLRNAASARLQDPGLRPHDIAEAAGVSVRYANLLLSAQGTSLARLILTSRLERCRAALSDNSQRHRSITDIAFGWGFSDLSHFSRVFAKAYGLAPRDYRAAEDPHRYSGG